MCCRTVGPGQRGTELGLHAELLWVLLPVHMLLETLGWRMFLTQGLVQSVSDLPSVCVCVCVTCLSI